MSGTNNILLVLDKRDHESLFQLSLQGIEAYNIRAVISASENVFLNAARYIPDLIIIQQQRIEPVLIEQLKLIKKEHAIPVVFFSGDDSRECIEMAIHSGVMIYTTSSPDHVQLGTLLDTAMIRFQEYHSLQKELTETKTLLEERKLIEQAKGILMRQSCMDEQTTYKTMRKMSMDRNLKMSELSQTIIAAAALMN